MKIIEWNCQGAFRKKSDKILALNPDILIVTECESEDKLEFGKLTEKPNDFFWYGEKHKGIGVFFTPLLVFVPQAGKQGYHQHLFGFTAYNQWHK